MPRRKAHPRRKTAPQRIEAERRLNDDYVAANATSRPAASKTPSRLYGRDGEEAPLAGHALELVSAAVLEFEP